MSKIKKVSLKDADRFVLNKKLWGFDAYDAEVYAQIAYDEQGFKIKFTIGESNPFIEKKHHFEEVCEDSCVEFFVNFTPEQSDKYINFEVNAAGVMYAAIGTDRYNNAFLQLEEIEGLNIHTEIKEEYWMVSYEISYELIKKYYPYFDIKQCDYILGNLYKCGSKTAYRHYLSYFEVGTEKPDFHRPEYFGKLIVVGQESVVR